MLEYVKNNFAAVYGQKEVAVYFAPGRVNLIGEYTDISGGHVFPCSIDLGTYLVAHKRDDSKLRFYSENFKELGIIETTTDEIHYNVKDDWANYPKGVISVLLEMGYDINSGFDLYFYGNIPNGSGLSSSASIELVTGVMLDDQFKFDIDRVILVGYCQRAENNFVGVNCGIMDQFAIGMGKANHALLLNTSNLKYDYVPFENDGYQIIVTNTNKRRSLTESKYNERRSECDLGLENLQKSLDISSLGDISVEDFELNSHLIKSDIVRRRVKHAVYENKRTLLAKEALTKGKIETFGQLMNESHISLRDDFEVTGHELDTLVSLAWRDAGVIGSRMTGAGFGGCIVSLVKSDSVEHFIQSISEAYEDKIGYKPSFYCVTIGEGAKKII